MRRLIVCTLVLLTSAPSFAQESSDTQPASGVSAQISLSSDLLDQGEYVTAAWLAYAAVGAQWIQEEYLKQNPDESVYRYSFTEEWKARETLVEVWSEFKEKNPRLRNAYLTALAQIKKAGFLREYVWVYLNSREWTSAPEDLNLDGFEKFRKNSLRSHQAQTLTIARPIKGEKKSGAADSPVMSRIGKAPLNSPSDSLDIIHLYNRAVQKAADGKLTDAAALYTKVLDLDPVHTDAMDNLGLIYRQLGRYDEAIQLYRKSLALIPDNKVALMNLGVALQMSNRHPEALDEYEKLKKFYPNDPEGYFGAGNVNTKMGRLGDAIEEFIKAKDLYHAANSPYEKDAGRAIDMIKKELNDNPPESLKRGAGKKIYLNVGTAARLTMKSRGYDKPEEGGWHRTGIIFNQNESYLILVDGAYQTMLGSKSGDATGYTNNVGWMFGSGKIVENVTRGAVLGRINNRVFYIGNHTEFMTSTERDSGELMLGFNEKRVNRSGVYGNFTATIKRMK